MRIILILCNQIRWHLIKLINYYHTEDKRDIQITLLIATDLIYLISLLWIGKFNARSAMQITQVFLSSNVGLLIYVEIQSWRCSTRFHIIVQWFMISNISVFMNISAELIKGWRQGLVSTCQFRSGVANLNICIRLLIHTGFWVQNEYIMRRVEKLY